MSSTETVAPRQLYTEGRKFRVIREGARLSGLVPSGPSAHRGYGFDLHVGDVITCTGWSMGWGSDSIPCTHWTAEGIDPSAQFVDFRPTAGLWQPYPADGFVEPIEEV